MSPKFSQSFKKQAVEKALNRQDNTSLKEVADSLGVGLSSLSRWTLQAKNQELETISFNEVNTPSGLDIRRALKHDHKLCGTGRASTE